MRTRNAEIAYSRRHLVGVDDLDLDNDNYLIALSVVGLRLDVLCLNIEILHVTCHLP